MSSTEKRVNDLKKAAINGDYEFLRRCVASKTPKSTSFTYIESISEQRNYYLTIFPGISGGYYGNIFHLAARLNREEFIREAIKSLPLDVIQQLLVQVDSQVTLRNPLHTAAVMGNIKITKMFLSVYEAPSSSTHAQPSIVPWLCKDSNGFTPCAAAVRFGYEDCGLELLRMDLEKLSNITTNQGCSVLYSAVSFGCKKIAFEILKSSPSLSYAGPDGYNVLHFVTNLTEGEDICRLLLVREPTLITQRSSNGCSILSVWAKAGKMWPFECLLKCNDIVPNIRSTLVNLLSTIEDHDGSNSLHRLARISGINEKYAIDFAQLLIDTYKKEMPSNLMSSIQKPKGKKEEKGSTISGELFPWLAEDKLGWTPLTIAIFYGNEKFATYILSVDNNALLEPDKNALFLAMDKGCHEVANMILDIVDKHGWTQLLTDHHQGINVLHLAPKCKRDLFERLLKCHPELLELSNMDTGFTILHMWVWLGEVWPIKYILQSGEIQYQWQLYFTNNLIPALDYSGNNPFHIIAATTHKEKNEIAKLLIEAFTDQRTLMHRLGGLPWFTTNQNGDGPLHLAILTHSENFALYIMSLHEGHLSQVLDLYNPVHRIVFLAIEKNCYQIAKVILERLNKSRGWSTYLRNSSNGRNVLHLAPACQDKDFGIWLVNTAQEFILETDENGNTPLDEASNVGAEWIIKAMLEIPSTITRAPLAWIKACENGHISALQAFVDINPTRFRNLCFEHKDSPLHHVKFTNLFGYRELLEIPCMKDLINVQDSQGQTPLHKAIRNGNILLAETLLKMEGIEYNIKDNENQTVIDLLGQICQTQHEWDHMCKNLGFDPKIKMAYFQHKTNLLDVRSTLSVVAALLATITFTAGFTLPGGFNQDTGDAILAKKAAFLVFLISDTLAFFFSMLVLVCLIWSMVYEPSKSLLLIDRSMVVLMRALYCTLLAFMTGVYIVISPKSLWAAILILVIMCTLIGISISKTLLYQVIDKLIPAASTDHIDPFRQLELGKVFPCFGGTRSFKPE